MKPLLAGIRTTLRDLRARCDQPEFEQGLIRLTAAVIVLLSFAIYVGRDVSIDEREWPVMLAVLAYFATAISLLIRMIVAGDVSPARRYIGLTVDNIGITYFMAMMGEDGAVMFGLYLFIIFGNGFRYGRRYLHICQAMSLIGFASVVVIDPHWANQRSVAMACFFAILVLPFYVSVLAQRINEAKRRADEASQAKGRFVANVSHEMRTPLNGVIAMADVLRETDLTEAQREIVETMTTSAQLLLAQIEDVLDMAKIEAGRVLVETRPFDLGKLLSSTVKVIVPQARYKGIEVHTDVSESASQWFAGDPHHLRQVLLNLLSNAVKFTEQGHISVRALALDTEDPTRKKLRIEVQDTGIGIAPEKQAAIFEPFTQADDSITRVYGGTGLGTTIARHLVQLMGGQIGIVSALGTGSMFWIEFVLPVSEPQGIDLASELGVTRASVLAPYGAGAGGAGTKVHKLRGARILVAEDNPTNQRVAQLILESRGHIVTIVGNGEGALDALERGGFEIALFDLSMPVVSGLEALKLYRFTNPKPIPVLILSANVTTEAISECQRAGAAEFIPKPLRASHLLDAIDRHLDERADVAPAPAPPRSDEKTALAVVTVSPIDPQVVQELSQLSSDPTFLERLMRGFQADTQRLVAELSTALSQRKYDVAKDAAHALKGGAASVGASQIMQIVTRIEKSSNEMLRARSAQLIEELLQAQNRAMIAVDDLVEERNRKRQTPT